MKHVLISILLLTFAASAVWAQPQGKRMGPGMRGQGQSPRMQLAQQNLGLSQEQVEQINTIRRNGGGRDEIRAALTEEQRAMMDAHRAARQGQGGPGNRGNRPGRGYGNRADQTAAPGDSSEPGNG